MIESSPERKRRSAIEASSLSASSAMAWPVLEGDVCGESAPHSITSRGDAVAVMTWQCCGADVLAVLRMMCVAASAASGDRAAVATTVSMSRPRSRGDPSATSARKASLRPARTSRAPPQTAPQQAKSRNEKQQVRGFVGSRSLACALRARWEGGRACPHTRQPDAPSDRFDRLA